MNSPIMLRLSSVLAGLTITLLLASWIVPFLQFSKAGQFDFWLVWLLCMVVLALPFSLLEVALAKRSKATPLSALMVLTREADAKPVWRLVGWLSAAVMALVAGRLLYQSSAMAFGGMDNVPVEAMTYLPMMMMVLGIALSFVPRQVLIIVASIAAVIATVFSFAQVGVGTWQWTAFSLQEWAWAVSLALVASGLGFGIYWQLNANKSGNQNATQSTNQSTLASTVASSHATSSALPFWVAQIIGGLMIAMVQGFHGTVALWFYGVALLTGGAFLINLVREQLQARGIHQLLQWVFIMVGLLVWLLPMQSMLTLITVILALIVCVLYAVFSGWMMKISHLRKALNFEHEAIYNLWRIAVRVVIPVAVIVAIIGLVLPA